MKLGPDLSSFKRSLKTLFNHWFEPESFPRDWCPWTKFLSKILKLALCVLGWISQRVRTRSYLELGQVTLVTQTFKMTQIKLGKSVSTFVRLDCSTFFKNFEATPLTIVLLVLTQLLLPLNSSLQHNPRLKLNWVLKLIRQLNLSMKMA